MLNGLDLFSGIGGISLALREWVRPITYCEIDPYCQGVLLSRMSNNDIPCSPIWDDIKTLGGREFFGITDIVYGGFPCQDISVAGLGKGLEGERSGLFFEIVRLCREIKPRFIFLENVPAITSRGGSEVVREIAALGYDCRWCIISAASVGALHRRERWFLLAHAIDNGTSASQDRGSIKEKYVPRINEHSKNSWKIERASCVSSDVANAMCERLEGQREVTGGTKTKQCNDNNTCYPFRSREHWQKTVSSMGKCSYGVSDHVAKLRALGNSVVPQQVKEAFEILMGLK